MEDQRNTLLDHDTFPIRKPRPFDCSSPRGRNTRARDSLDPLRSSRHRMKSRNEFVRSSLLVDLAPHRVRIYSTSKSNGDDTHTRTHIPTQTHTYTPPRHCDDCGGSASNEKRLRPWLTERDDATREFHRAFPSRRPTKPCRYNIHN